MKDYQIISLGRDNIVLRLEGKGISGGENGSIIRKSYLPQQYPEYQQVYGQNSSFRINVRGRNVIRERFGREVAVLEALADLKPSLVPRVLAVYRERLEFDLEDVPYPTIRDLYLDTDRDYLSTYSRDALTLQMVDALSKFHQHCYTHLSEILDKVNNNSPSRLREETEEEEFFRFRNYAEAIVFNNSSDFQSYWQEKGLPNPNKLHNTTVRRHVRRFLEKQHLDLEKRIGHFVAEGRKINCYGQSKRETVFLSGDFSPQNLFYNPNGETIIGDFDKAHLGPRDVDLITAVFNIHNYPFDKNRESFLLDAVRSYYLTVPEIPPDQVAERVVALLSSRLADNFRLLAVYSQMSSAEIRKFLGDQGLSTELENGDLRADFRRKMFTDRFKAVLDYYRCGFGEGWAVVEEELLYSGTRRSERLGLLQQLRERFQQIENILAVGGVIKAAVSNTLRSNRFRRVLAEPY